MAVLCFTDDFKVIFEFQNLSETFAHDSVVVSQQNFNSFHGFCCAINIVLNSFQWFCEQYVSVASLRLWGELLTDCRPIPSNSASLNGRSETGSETEQVGSGMNGRRRS